MLAGEKLTLCKDEGLLLPLLRPKLLREEEETHSRELLRRRENREVEGSERAAGRGGVQSLLPAGHHHHSAVIAMGGGGQRERQTSNALVRVIHKNPRSSSLFFGIPVVVRECERVLRHARITVRKQSGISQFPPEEKLQSSPLVCNPSHKT